MEEVDVEVIVMRTLLVVSACLITGCVSNPSLVGTSDPIIDTKGVDMNQYMIDKRECQAYASEVRRGEKIARGAAAGAVVGGAIGAVINREPNSTERGAGVGAISGAARGAGEGAREAGRVVKQCLRGRGYRVLN